tara:strand:- start:52591 stop:53367 length:777 start_codon:yes stop_codon:yes gene_type:complete
MILENLITNIFGTKKLYEVNIKKLPSQGYFYPENLKIYINKGDLDDQLRYYHGIDNSNIFGMISTLKNLLVNRVEFNLKDFIFDRLRAIDIFFMFIEFIKHTTGKKLYISGIEFNYNNFVYFDFDQFSKNYDPIKRAFVFGDWTFSLPSIGIETSLSQFSYKISINGETDRYKEKNYNLIYFLGDKNKLNYNDMINLIDLFEDLTDVHQEEVNTIVKSFSKSGLYFLIKIGKKAIRINPDMLKNIWPIEDDDLSIYVS